MSNINDFPSLESNSSDKKKHIPFIAILMGICVIFPFSIPFLLFYVFNIDFESLSKEKAVPEDNEEISDELQVYDVDELQFEDPVEVIVEKNDGWTITQYASSNEIQAMIYTVEDVDGNLAIIDGGYTYDNEKIRNIIVSHDNHVTTWIITHPHPDHVGSFNAIMDAPGDIEVDEIYSVDVNVDRYRETAQSYDGFESCEEFYRILGTIDSSKIHFVHKGDTFDVLGLRAEVFSAWDENVDALPDHLCNDGSMMFLLSGNEESMLFCADVQKEMEPFIELSEAACSAKYVQAGHHGNWGLSTEFYDLLSPEMVFFDSTDYLLDPDSNFDALALKEYFEGRSIEVVNYSNAPTTVVLH